MQGAFSQRRVSIPRNIKKFVNPKFVKTIDLAILRRLLERHAASLQALDLAALDADTLETREALLRFFKGPEEHYPEGLLADLHRIAELGSARGLTIITEQAARMGVDLMWSGQAGDLRDQDPKHVAVRVFLDHPQNFDRAADWSALGARSSLAEFVGLEEGVEADLTDETKARFEHDVRALFLADMRGDHCRVGWYDDADEINLVVEHGSPVNTTEVVGEAESWVISFRAAEHATLIYSAATALLKIGGVAKARRAEVAEIFARTMLGRPGFFAAEDAQNIYTLEPVERAGYGYALQAAYDPSIRRVQITEAQIDRVMLDHRSGEERVAHSLIARDTRGGEALARLGDAMRGQPMGGEWRLNYLSIRVEIEAGGSRPSRVAVKVKPPSSVQFKRERFEHTIVTLLRRNGLVHDRNARELAHAAE